MSVLIHGETIGRRIFEAKDRRHTPHPTLDDDGPLAVVVRTFDRCEQRTNEFFELLKIRSTNIDVQTEPVKESKPDDFLHHFCFISFPFKRGGSI